VATLESEGSLEGPSLPRPARLTLWVLAAAGVVAFLVTLRLDATRAWQAFLVNFLYWSGIAQAGVAFSALLEVSNARWGQPLRRLAEATCAFMPVSFALLLVLFLGWPTLVPWLDGPAGQAQPWLRLSLLLPRQVIGLFLLYATSMLYVYWSVRPERRAPSSSAPARLLERGWRGEAAELERSRRARSRLAPAILLLYAVVLSQIAFDWVMSLDPRWYSSLLGAYFFVGNGYLGIAALVVLAVWGRSRLGLASALGPGRFHDLGKLLLGFAMLWTYLFFTQYLVIWYGNLPEETEFLIRRGALGGPWGPVAVVVLLACFALPFTALLSREVKRRPSRLLAVALVAALGLWLERYLLVVPSLWRGDGLPMGLPELAITAAFLAAFTLSLAAFLDALPRLAAATSAADPAFRKEEPA
jgi:hypothetical protein